MAVPGLHTDGALLTSTLALSSEAPTGKPGHSRVTLPHSARRIKSKLLTVAHTVPRDAVLAGVRTSEMSPFSSPPRALGTSGGAHTLPASEGGSFWFLELTSHVGSFPSPGHDGLCLDSAPSGLLFPPPGMFCVEHLCAGKPLPSSGPAETPPWKTSYDCPVLSRPPRPSVLHSPSFSCPPQHLSHTGVILAAYLLPLLLGHLGWCPAHERCSININTH